MVFEVFWGGLIEMGVNDDGRMIEKLRRGWLRSSRSLAMFAGTCTTAWTYDYD